MWKTILGKFFFEKIFFAQFFLDAEKQILRQKKNWWHFWGVKFFFDNRHNTLATGRAIYQNMAPRAIFWYIALPICQYTVSKAAPTLSVYGQFEHAFETLRRNLAAMFQKHRGRSYLNRLLKQCGEIFSPIVSKVCSIWSVDADFKLLPELARVILLVTAGIFSNIRVIFDWLYDQKNVKKNLGKFFFSKKFFSLNFFWTPKN